MRTLKESFNNMTNDKGVTFIDYNGDRYKPYKNIYEESLSILYELQKQGISAGDELIFQVEDNEKFISIFWACILGGIAVISFDVVTNLEHVEQLFNVINKLEKYKICFTKKTYENFKNVTCERKEYFEAIDSIKIMYPEVISKNKGVIANISPDDTAVIQFSSGSTGKPKGVVLSHRNIIANVESSIERFKLTKEDRALSWLPLTHNYGLIGVHIVSLIGNINQYYMPTQMFLENPILWMDKVNEYKIQVTSSSNFAYKYFLNFVKNKEFNWDLSMVKTIITGSEHISYEVCLEFLNSMKKYKLRRNCIHPAYGMTECSLAVSTYIPGDELYTHRFDRENLSIGEKINECDENLKALCFVDSSFPLNNVEVRICDENGTELSENYIGHIQVKGDSVMKNYYNDPEETHNSFTEDGWFKTGDIGLLSGGRLTVIGRSKDTIILNGKNYYPEDFERIIKSNMPKDWQDASVCGVSNYKEGYEKIVAFIQYNDDINRFLNNSSIIKKEVFKVTGINIDDIIPVKMLPRTRNGKIQRFKLINKYLDKKQILEDEENSTKDGEGFDGINDTEKMVLKIFSKVLKRNNFKLDDNIFEINANSLQVANIVAKINDEFKIRLQLDSFLKMENLQAVSDYIKNTASIHYEVIEKASESKFYITSSQQKRLYALNRVAPESKNYNISSAMYIEGNLDVKKFEDVFNELIGRHEGLRTSFEVEDGVPVQIINRNAKIKILAKTIKENQIDEYIKKIIKPFDLSKAPLMRVGLFKYDNNKWIFIMDIHHIITDGTSMGILIYEFMKLYNSKEVPKLEFQYKDYSKWQMKMIEENKFIDQKEYWKAVFKKSTSTLNLPLDYKRPKKQSFNGDSLIFYTGKELAKELKEKVTKTKSSLYTIILTSLSIVLAKYSGDEDIVIGTPFSGRTRSEFNNTIGMFVNTLPIRSFPSKNKILSELLKENDNLVINAIKNQDYQFDLLIDELDINKDKSRNPLFDVMLTMWNMDLPDMKINDVKFTTYDILEKSSKVDISIIVEEKDEDIKLKVSYCTDLYKKDTMLKFENHLLNVFKTMVNNDDLRVEEVNILSEDETLEIGSESFEEEFNLDIDFKF